MNVGKCVEIHLILTYERFIIVFVVFVTFVAIHNKLIIVIFI